jgi:hypothetical protein
MSDLGEYVEGSRVQGASDHERDASLGAVAAFAMESRLTGWRDLYAQEPAPITPLDPPPRVVEVPKPLDLGRHVGELPELRGGQ